LTFDEVIFDVLTLSRRNTFWQILAKYKNLANVDYFDEFFNIWQVKKIFNACTLAKFTHECSNLNLNKKRILFYYFVDNI
jgi:hypothetical protein